MSDCFEWQVAILNRTFFSSFKKKALVFYEWEFFFSSVSSDNIDVKLFETKNKSVA